MIRRSYERPHTISFHVSTQHRPNSLDSFDTAMFLKGFSPGDESPFWKKEEVE